VVGDQRPFIGALVTLDAEMLSPWARNNGLQGLSLDEARTNEIVHAEITRAVDDANKAVSKAESIRKFTVLGRRLHRGQRLPDPFAEAEAQHGDEGLRVRGGNVVRRPQGMTVRH